MSELWCRHITLVGGHLWFCSWVYSVNGREMDLDTLMYVFPPILISLICIPKFSIVIHLPISRVQHTDAIQHESHRTVSERLNGMVLRFPFRSHAAACCPGMGYAWVLAHACCECGILGCMGLVRRWSEESFCRACRRGVLYPFQPRLCIHRKYFHFIKHSDVLNESSI